MKNPFKGRLGLSATVFVGLGLVAGTSQSATSIGGYAGRALWAADQGCFQRQSGWASVSNICPSSSKIFVVSPAISPGSHVINARVYDTPGNVGGGLVSCFAVEVNSNGGGAWTGTVQTSTPGGGWQDLNLGTRTTGSAHTLHVECTLGNYPIGGAGKLQKVDF